MIWRKGAQQSTKLVPWYAPFVESIENFSQKSTEELCLMTLRSHAKFEKFVVWKMTRIWWILIRAIKSLKNLHFHWSLLSKVYNFGPKKSTEELSYMILKCNVKFEVKQTCDLENDMRNFANFYQNIRMCQNWDFDGVLLFKVENA